MTTTRLCIMCGKAIHPARLDAIPHAKTCDRDCSDDYGRQLRRDGHRKKMEREQGTEH